MQRTLWISNDFGTKLIFWHLYSLLQTQFIFYLLVLVHKIYRQGQFDIIISDWLFDFQNYLALTEKYTTYQNNSFLFYYKQNLPSSMYDIVFIKRVDIREMGHEKLNYVDDMMNRDSEGSTNQCLFMLFLIQIFILIKQRTLIFFMISPRLQLKVR